MAEGKGGKGKGKGPKRPKGASKDWKPDHVPLGKLEDRRKVLDKLIAKRIQNPGRWV